MYIICLEGRYILNFKVGGNGKLSYFCKHRLSIAIFLKGQNMNLRSFFMGLVACCASVATAQNLRTSEPQNVLTSEPQNLRTSQDVIVYFKAGGAVVYPSDITRGVEQDADAVRITLVNDSVIAFPMAEVDSVGSQVPQNLPVFTSFKFNNKYNDQVFTDVVATVTADTVRARVGAIGKWLTPSFNVSDEGARVWVNSREQVSKQSRVCFEGDVTYTIGYDGWQVLSYTKVKDEVWSEPTDGAIYERINLTADQLSTNAPSNYDEDVDKLVDDNTGTYFHSTWGNGEYEKLPMSDFPYIEVALEEELQQFVFGYTTSFKHDNRTPLSFFLQVSADGEEWTDVKDFTAEDGVPQSGVGVTYESPLVSLDAPCRFIRLTMTEASYKNYLVLSEFWLKEYVGESDPEGPTLVSPAEYAYQMRPFGRDVCVRVEWPTDTAHVPAIYIDTENGQFPADKETYLKASIRIDGAGVYPDFSDSVNIRGRGNSSWAGQYGKSPYRLKFDSSKKPFGLTKGKSWVLLANRQTGSMLSNAVAMKIASMVETAGANRIIPVDLYLNGIYRGSYNFTQQVGLSNNSIDLDDETYATLLELDSYYDEPYKFRPYSYYLPTNIKDPDLEDFEDPYPMYDLIREDFSNFTDVLYQGTDDYANLIDVESFARFLLVNDLVMNLELGHPKSTYLYKEDLRALHSRYVFGPVWDFDWAYGYENTYSYCTTDPKQHYFDKLIRNYGYDFFYDLRHNSEAVGRAYYKEWKDFMEKHREELLDYVETYYQYAKSSFESNANVWSDGKNYETVKNNTINWLAERSQFIFDNLEAYDLETPMNYSVGDANLDGYITVADVTCILNKILGRKNETFNFDQADVDCNSVITVNDVVHAVALVMNQPEESSTALTRPKAEATLTMQPFQVGMGEATYCPLTLQVESDAYTALQFELHLPRQMTLQDVDLSAVFEGHKAVFQELSSGTYRVVVYSNNGKALPAGAHEIYLALTPTQMLPEAQRVVSTSAVLLANTLGEDHRVGAQTTNFDVATTGIHHALHDTAIQGGETLIVESASARMLSVYGLDGRCVKKVALHPGKNTIELPNGIYVVENVKVTISK